MAKPKKNTSPKTRTHPKEQYGKLSYLYYHSAADNDVKQKEKPKPVTKKSKKSKFDVSFWVILLMLGFCLFYVPKTIISSHNTHKQPAFNKQARSTTDPMSTWVLVNKTHPITPATYIPSNLTDVGNGQQMRSEAADAFHTMQRDAEKAGYTITAESGYRSYDLQKTAYDSEVSSYGATYADNESARPGYSEHQTGFAVDIESLNCAEDCFGGTEASKWVLKNASNYGFIQRYPPSKQDITGYRNEVWHFRYVGKTLADELAKTGQSVEEFFGAGPAPNYN